MIRYVITVFVIALALGASTSLLASPPIGAVVQTWNYDPKTNSVTLKVVNTSQKDITAFNIAIKETLADGCVDKHEMLEDLIGKVVLARFAFAWDAEYTLLIGSATTNRGLRIVTERLPPGPNLDTSTPPTIPAGSFWEAGKRKS